MSGIQDSAFKKYLATIPSVFKPEYNPVMRALLLAISESDDEICKQIQNGKDQLFIRTANGDGLVNLAQSLGVAKPIGLGLADIEFQELVPNLSLKPMQLKKSFYDTADVFWGPLFSRANIITNNVAPYNLNVGDELIFAIDNGPQQIIKIVASDFVIPGAITAQELVNILTKLNGTTAQIIDDLLTGNQTVNLRTNTPGSVGTIEVVASSGIGVSKVDFIIGIYDILNLDQRVSVYNINPNELLIEIPAIVPALRRTLKGSHHFHQDSTLEPPQGIQQGIWQGSFLFNPTGTVGNFTITGQTSVIQQTINKGQILTSLLVDDTSKFENETGTLIFGFGTEKQEIPVKYRGVPNSNTILVDPGHIFEFDHAIGTIVNVVSNGNALTPNRNGDDLAIYMTSPSAAREIVEDILETLAAAGIIVRFLVLAPKYKYLIDNPYINDDNPNQC